MRRLVVLLLASAALLSAATTTYRLAPAEGGKLSLEVEKTGLMKGKKHVFLFPRYQGTLRYDPDQPAASQLEFTIDSASIHCTDTWVSEKDLRKVQAYAEKDMLAVSSYPEIKFRSTAITATGPSQFKVTGDLTIRNVTRPVQLTLQTSQNGTSLWSDGSGTIKLTDYQLKPPTAALGTIGTKDEMLVQFRVRFDKAAN